MRFLVHAGLSKLDQESSLRGMELSIRAMVAAGAEVVGPVNSGPSNLYRTAGGTPEALEEYIGRVRANGIVSNTTQAGAIPRHPRKIFSFM